MGPGHRNGWAHRRPWRLRHQLWRALMRVGLICSALAAALTVAHHHLHLPSPWIWPALTLLAVLALASLLSRGLAARIGLRIEALRQVAESWGQGDLEARAPVEGGDELGALARSFNGAADRVQSLMRARQQSLASASHELRSPLARLRMALALAEAEEPAARQAALAEAERNVEELDLLITQLLLSGRLSAGAGLVQRESVDLAALMTEEAARAGAEAPELDPAAAPIEGDAVLLRHLLRNLYENARQHGLPPLRSGLGPGPLLWVRDAGPALSAELSEQIFTPFFRRPGQGAGGTGLGLALVRQVAEAHGGSARYVLLDGGGRFELRWGKAPEAGSGSRPSAWGPDGGPEARSRAEKGRP